MTLTTDTVTLALTAIQMGIIFFVIIDLIRLVIGRH